MLCVYCNGLLYSGDVYVSSKDVFDSETCDWQQKASLEGRLIRSISTYPGFLCADSSGDDVKENRNWTGL